MARLELIKEKLKNWKVIVMVLSALVVFVTTYALILPAITLDDDTAKAQGGIDLDAGQDADAAADQDAAAADDEAFAEDTTSGDVKQAAGELVASDEDKTYNIGLAYGKRADIPDDAELVVEEITEETEGYDEYLERTQEAVGKNKTVAFARFFDIKIMSGEEEIQPADNVEVMIEVPDDLKKKDVAAIHFGEPENDGDEVEDVVLETEVGKSETKKMESAVTFETDGFSVYAVVTTIEGVILTSDGHQYKITVACGEDAGVPEGAQLAVSEITADGDDEARDGDAGASGNDKYDKYVARTEKALGWEKGSASYMRLFDIKIVDADGEKITIQAPVDVKIELMDKEDSEEADKDTQVVHFADGAKKGDVVEGVTVDGGAISFSADGFSTYVIANGPDALAVDWHTISSFEEFESFVSQGKGLYIGHPNGFYFMNTITSTSGRTGITKTTPANTSNPTIDAAVYYFEKKSGTGTTDLYYAYCYDANNNKQYVYNGGNNSLSFKTSQSQATAFEVLFDERGYFKVHNGKWYWNMQGGDNGTRFCSYDNAEDPNASLYFWYYEELDEDPYRLDGVSYGFMNWNGGPAGKAMMAEASSGNLKAEQLTVMTRDLAQGEPAGNQVKLFVPQSAQDMTVWTFHWVSEDKYIISADSGGCLNIDETTGELSIVPYEDATPVQVVAGTGVHAGQICLKSGNKTLTYSGNIDTGFNTGGSTGSEWLYLAERSSSTPPDNYYMTHSASKISVSDPSLANVEGEPKPQIIVYTRVWDDDEKKYKFFAIDSDGSLVACTENGDSIEWIGGLFNTMLWEFTEYYDERTGEPNGYFELYNQYSGKYIAPQITGGGQTLSDDTIGINLTGRSDGKYYTPILAWDDDSYAYAGLKVENNKIVPCSKSEAMDFYFAIVEETPADDIMHDVPTVDHKQYGISVKLYDFESRPQMSNFLGNNEGGAVKKTVPGLLSNKLDEDGYPTVSSGSSLADLFGMDGVEERDTNHLFIQSTYNSSGYFEFDSTQNFASLQDNNDFLVYKEIATYDTGGNRETLKHGQFFPFNDIEPGVFASVNGRNLYTATADPLDKHDPRYNEQLYLIEGADCYYGMELEASFIQTPSGLDAWGHDIIYEFTGDDDFWLYVDGELVIDLGGIHSALPGSVNFRSGDVTMIGGNGQVIHTTLKDIFYNNCIARGESEEAAQAYVNEKFVQIDDPDDPNNGKWIFKSNTSHTMKIFYMERGGGAANLHMRFNLASIKPGSVELSKELSGVDDSETILAQFPYQIMYRIWDEKNHRWVTEEKVLTNEKKEKENPDDPDPPYPVTYKDTVTPVPFISEEEGGVTVDGITYNDVFMLKPGETATVDFTAAKDVDLGENEVVKYRIVECGVNTDVYSKVSVNGDEIEGTLVSGHNNRKDYGFGSADNYKSTDDYPRAAFDNKVNPDALRTLTLDKKLFHEDGTTPISHVEDNTIFSFRLYLGTEFDSSLPLAKMHSYHVKDESGNYCRWDSDAKTFVSLGITEYSELTDEQKEAATFHTSRYGSISKIPADYTVEVRGLLAGTMFGVVERPDEMPDGYTFQKYMYTDDYPDTDAADYVDGEEHLVPAATGVTDTTVAGKDPHVDICNLKGWGLRVNKKWSDQDYMSNREDTYFAVFIRGTGSNGEETLTLVDDLAEDEDVRTVKRMSFDSDPSSQTLYWFFLPLPVNVDFDRYEVREVTVENPVVDDDGNVTSHGRVSPILHEGEVILGGTQKGESASSAFTYTVLYQKGTVPDNSHVRVDEATNNRPGIVLNKTDWEGNPLEGATFTLKDDEGTLIGTFTSDEEGQITVAFLRDNVEYTLTETETPQGFHGLEAPMKIKLNNGAVTVEGVEDEWYSIDQGEGKTPTVTIKNRPYTFKVVKKDRSSADDPLPVMEGVAFSLFRQITVGTTTSFDPMPGYPDNLITDSHGVVPRVDNTLPANIYELRETTPEGYEALPSDIDFSLSPTGVIEMVNHPEGVTLHATVDENDETGTLSYELEVLNSKPKKVSFMKVDLAEPGTPLAGAKFNLYKIVNGQRQTLYTNLTSNAEGMLLHPHVNGISDAVFVLPSGTYVLEETKEPNGYNKRTEPITITITREYDKTGKAFDEVGSTNGVSYDEDTTLSDSGTGIQYVVDNETYTLKISNTSGVELPSSGGPGTTIFYILGALLMLLAGGGLVVRRRTM